MSITERIHLWWKSMTPSEKVNAVFKGITSTAAVIGAGCCIHEVRTSRRLVSAAVDTIGDSVDVEVSQELIDAAVEKATNAHISKTVKAAVDRNWRDIQTETGKKVEEAVRASREEISQGVAEALAKECEKINRSDILTDIRDKAKDALAEKLDNKLDEITDEYSKNLSNMGKVYEALAEKLQSKA